MGVRKALYPGSFDPVTFGHLDVIERATHLVDELVVAVAVNEAKSPVFSAEERVDLLRTALQGRSGVRVEQFDGLLIEYARREQINVVIRGLRAVSDFEFEFQMALMNRRLLPQLETVFLTPREDVTFLSSRLVKEVARLGGKVDQFVPPEVVGALRKKFLS
jgi:pantetheine-phosphate adenylyltransferase